jgi:hypothetical protein
MMTTRRVYLVEIFHERLILVLLSLDPGIAATMIAAMVVGVVLTTKNFVMDRIAQLGIVLKSSSELLQCYI